MKKLLVQLLTLIGLVTLTACSEVQETKTSQEKITFSDNILLSVNNGTAGDGTLADCTDATIIIYKDRTVKVHMHVTDYPEIGSVTLSEEDYNAIAEIAVPEEIANYKVTDGEAVMALPTTFLYMMRMIKKSLLRAVIWLPVRNSVPLIGQFMKFWQNTK